MFLSRSDSGAKIHGDRLARGREAVLQRGAVNPPVGVGKRWPWPQAVAMTLADMGVKIKANDDRILATATGILLLSRADLIKRGLTSGMITRALDTYRNDYATYKIDNPKRDRAAVADLSGFEHEGRRVVYEKLLVAVDTILAKIERNSTQFSSLLELDNFFAFNLKSFD